MKEFLEKMKNLIPGERGPGAAQRKGRARKDFGARGEHYAAKHLERQGFKIIERNYTCPLGELDLVARKGPLLVFCEVKTRSTAKMGPPELAVNHGKQRKIVRLAKYYIKNNRLENLQCRFDVVTVQWGEGKKPEVRHIPAAFLS